MNRNGVIKIKNSGYCKKLPKWENKNGDKSTNWSAIWEIHGTFQISSW